MSDIYRDTLKAFLDENPQPEPLDFPCSRCGAQQDNECTTPKGRAVSGHHAPRLDRVLTARLKRHNAAHNAAYAALDAANNKEQN